MPPSRFVRAYGSSWIGNSDSMVSSSAVPTVMWIVEPVGEKPLNGFSIQRVMAP